MTHLRAAPASLPILIGAAVLLSVSMGLRQSFGLFMQPATQELAISVADFTLAIAVQNLVWGAAQPFAGAFAGRWGFRPVLIAGALLYLLGLLVFATAQGALGITLGAGVLVGVALACASAAMAMSVASRVVSDERRSTVLGMVSAAGSIGALLAAPLGQGLADAYDWRVGLFGFVVLGLTMLPAAFVAGRADRIPVPRAGGAVATGDSARAAVRVALRHPPFLVMTGAYMVCGLQLVFLTTHLPSYLALCGQDPMLAAKALAVIGGFNIAGSLFFGWAGGRWSKQGLLGVMYTTRSLVLAWYFVSTPTPESTLLFAALMGFLWMGVGPLMAGAVVEMFGLRWQAMVQGLAFLSHQLGSFLGAYGGGLLYDSLGSYTLAVQLGVSMGLAGGLLQMFMAWGRPKAPQAPLPAAV
jgi:predicted MFS family arabinose efflux permease